MTSSNTNHAMPHSSWIKILLDKLRLTLRFRMRPPEIDDVRPPLMAHAAIGSPGRTRLSKEARAMNRVLLVLGILVLMMGANTAFAQVQTCAIITGGDAGGAGGVNPTYLANQDGRANEGCTILITLNADGSIATTFPNPAPAYENGNDDNMIGVVNNTSKTITAIIAHQRNNSNLWPRRRWSLWRPWSTRFLVLLSLIRQLRKHNGPATVMLLRELTTPYLT